jgi:predicted small integral membrane protein
MLGSLALFAGLVTFDNLTDYQTNYAFVGHVLSMDATPPGNALMYRSINPGGADLCHAKGRIGCCRDGRLGV